MGPIELLKQQHRDVEQLFDRIRTASRGEKLQLVTQLVEDLTVHALLEERIFYPAAGRLRELNGLLARSHADHAKVKQFLGDLLKMKQTDPRIDEVLALVQRHVTEHVAEEEEQLFPRVEAELGGSLEGVGNDMEKTQTELRSQDLLEVAEEQAPSGGQPQ